MSEDKREEDRTRQKQNNFLNKISFANFSQGLKDPEPPMLKKGPDSVDQQNFTPKIEKTTHMSKQGQEYFKKHEPTFYFPGSTPGQPHKVDRFRYCYSFFRRVKEESKQDENFDFFLYRADQDINYYQPKLMPELRRMSASQEMNPHNPFGLQTEFKI